MSVYLEKHILQDILSARFVWNPFEDKVFESSVEFFPYFFGRWDHDNASFSGFVLTYRTLIVQYAALDR